MRVVVLESRAPSSVNWRGALIEDALGPAGSAIGGALGRSIDRAPVTAWAHRLLEAAGMIGAAAPA